MVEAKWPAPGGITNQRTHFCQKALILPPLLRKFQLKKLLVLSKIPSEICQEKTQTLFASKYPKYCTQDAPNLSKEERIASLTLIRELLYSDGQPALLGDLMEKCLTSTYFTVQGQFYKQISGTPIASNIFMEAFEDTYIESAQLKPKVWFRYMDDTFVIMAPCSKCPFTTISTVNTPTFSLSWKWKPIIVLLFLMLW